MTTTNIRIAEIIEIAREHPDYGIHARKFLCWIIDSLLEDGVVDDQEVEDTKVWIWRRTEKLGTLSIYLSRDSDHLLSADDPAYWPKAHAFWDEAIEELRNG